MVGILEPHSHELLQKRLLVQRKLLSVRNETASVDCSEQSLGILAVMTVLSCDVQKQIQILLGRSYPQFIWNSLGKAGRQGREARYRILQRSLGVAYPLGKKGRI